MAEPSEVSNLLSRAGESRRSNSTTLEEYDAIGLVVVENAGNEPIVVHDFNGPVLLERNTLERHDSMIETISVAISENEGLDVVALPHSGTSDGEATIPSEIASMTKGLVGCGALSLANGLARCSNSPEAAMVGNMWIAVFGLIFGYYCWLIGKVCELTGRSTYRGIWQETVGHRGSLFVSIANALKAALADLAYATILSDTLRSLLVAVGFHNVSRVFCLLIVTLVAILPLCLLKNLHVLAPFSILGTGGIVFTCMAMAVRYMDGSYLPGGAYYLDIRPIYRPEFGSDNNVWSTGILPFVCMVYESFVMHYNSARFYSELKDRSLPRFGVAVGSSFTVSAVLYMLISTFGYLTFGGSSSGYILNNYSPYDPLATICRLAVGLSTLMAYPIVFFGVRDGVMDAMEMPIADQQSPSKIRTLTILLLTVLTTIAVFVTDLGLINAVGGGLVASAIVFVFPTLMFYRALRLRALEDDKSVGKGQYYEMMLAIGLTVVGVVLGFIGAYTAVKNTVGSASSR